MIYFTYSPSHLLLSYYPSTPALSCCPPFIPLASKPSLLQYQHFPPCIARRKQRTTSRTNTTPPMVKQSGWPAGPLVLSEADRHQIQTALRYLNRLQADLT
ncbi:hypothetical protein HRR83_003076 [Exophiala dermatitidis]|uniref:Uncharacterized protein n=1 Tax=Exophiala dermatitidis TaxID=5970 RepID=A0AAN6ELT9_EXODE|nr:hypothetical protein HRR73_008179 [Exophiala dermatitidis]KAJ4506962.1 hypothetical protein HRR74_008278 [Exophiala dermatitidis]KAJ4547964.1 hypothetical protein HRR76_000584 [Exophiala dermatitidis]KAJ4553905.1 hypothetical protein HRR77_002274 [Exophiala dermatitidis]KAJ4578230.1 hypothetical protein HRR79_001546 [Exophiala dermatitidis]